MHLCFFIIFQNLYLLQLGMEKKKSTENSMEFPRELWISEYRMTNKYVYNCIINFLTYNI